MKNESRFLPPEIKNFWRLFENVSYKYQYSNVFDDFLTMCINYFANGIYREQRDAALKKYSEKEKQLFNEMFYCMIKSLEEIFKKYQWFDFFGTLYETIIINKGKQSGLGQFFTPPHIVDLMVRLNHSENEENKTIYDPTAGSGRMLISAHVYSPKNFVYAADIDNICCKMCVLNMFLHGCRGEVIHMDSLSGDFYNAWFIDTHPILKLPFIGELKKENSIIMQNYDIMAIKTEQKTAAPPEPQQQINFNISTEEVETAFFEQLF
jgi:type I restriction enzyme M protein